MRPPAQVGLLDVHEVGLVEASHVLQTEVSYCDARPHDPVDIPVAVVVTTRHTELPPKSPSRPQ